METEYQLVVTRVWGEGQWGVIANWYGLSFGVVENVLKLNSGDDGTTRWIY